MPEYLLELYAPRGDAVAGGAGAERVRVAAESVAAEGASVCYVRSMVVQAEETCFILLDAGSIEPVREVARRAGVPTAHLSEITDDTALDNSPDRYPTPTNPQE